MGDLGCNSEIEVKICFEMLYTIFLFAIASLYLGNQLQCTKVSLKTDISNFDLSRLFKHKSSGVIIANQKKL
jgi:hypothetical protein